MRPFRILVLSLLCLFVTLLAQSQVLKKNVTVHYRDAKVKDVLLGLESKYGIRFYYTNNMVPLYARINVNVQNQPLSTALEAIFNNTDISFVAVEDKIVLKKDPNKKKDKQEKKKSSLELTPTAKEMMVTASIDPSSLYPAFTVEELNSVPVVHESTFAPEEIYAGADTLLEPDQSFSKQKNRMLKRYMAKMDSLGKIGDVGSMEELKSKFNRSMEKLKTKVKAASDSLNVKSLPMFRDKTDTVKTVSPLQLTFVHPIGTNGSAARNVTNRASINALTGHAYALHGVEVGGLINLERTSVKGFQAGGLANFVGTSVKGAQVGGLLNTVGDGVKGAQFAGIVNIVGADAEGVQFAGIVNSVKGTNYGAQFAGIANINGDSSTGLQAAGITNVIRGSHIGTELAGIANVNKGSSAGFHAAGITNISEGITRGVRIAGIANVSGEEHNGVQIAGIVNRAKRVRGSQIGLINIADTVTGVTLGLINVVKNGYNKVEVYGGESMYTNFGLRLGSQKLHTILALGAQPSTLKENFRIAFGVGLGTFVPLTEKSGFTMDAMYYHINEGYNSYTDALNSLSQFKILYEYKVTNHFRLFAGPTLNVMTSEYFDKKRNEYGSAMPGGTLFHETYDKDGTPLDVKAWVGFNAGVRF